MNISPPPGFSVPETDAAMNKRDRRGRKRKQYKLRRQAKRVQPAFKSPCAVPMIDSLRYKLQEKQKSLRGMRTGAEQRRCRELGKRFVDKNGKINFNKLYDQLGVDDVESRELIKKLVQTGGLSSVPEIRQYMSQVQ